MIFFPSDVVVASIQRRFLVLHDIAKKRKNSKDYSRIFPRLSPNPARVQDEPRVLCSRRFAGAQYARRRIQTGPERETRPSFRSIETLNSNFVFFAGRGAGSQAWRLCARLPRQRTQDVERGPREQFPKDIKATPHRSGSSSFRCLEQLDELGLLRLLVKVDLFLLESGLELLYGHGRSLGSHGWQG